MAVVERLPEEPRLITSGCLDYRLETSTRPRPDSSFLRDSTLVRHFDPEQWEDLAPLTEALRSAQFAAPIDLLFDSGPEPVVVWDSGRERPAPPFERMGSDWWVPFLSCPLYLSNPAISPDGRAAVARLHLKEGMHSGIGTYFLERKLLGGWSISWTEFVRFA